MAVATSTVIASAALAATAVSGYQQYQAAGDAADAQKESNRISGAQQQIQQRQSTRQTIREQRIRRARILQSSENSGVGGSSSEGGSTSALNTLAGSSVAFGNSGVLASQGVSNMNQRRADASTNSQMWGAVGQLGSIAFQGAGGFSNFPGLFGSGQTSQPVQGGFTNEIFTGR